MAGIPSFPKMVIISRFKVSPGKGIAVGVSVGAGVGAGLGVAVSLGIGVEVGTCAVVAVGEGIVVGVAVGAAVGLLVQAITKRVKSATRTPRAENIAINFNRISTHHTIRDIVTMSIRSETLGLGLKIEHQDEPHYGRIVMAI